MDTAARTASVQLESFIPRDRRRALAAGRELPDRTSGAALFADISGFTPLTERLAVTYGAQRGAEGLNSTLNRVFSALIDDLAAVDGEVLYFSGDAITCWLAGDDGRRAVSCALAMQRTIAREGRVEVADDVVDLALKVAVVSGEARRFVVGDPDIQQIDLLAGELIDRLAATEQLAASGEVLVAESVLTALGDAVVVTERRLDTTTGHTVGVVTDLATGGRARTERAGLPALADEVVRRWVLPGVYDRLSGGAGEFFSELRRTYPIFLRFGGIDFDRDLDAGQQLDAFIRAVQHILQGYGGNIVDVTVGDKGAYIYATFGAPFSHEDDARRAVAAALELRDLERNSGVSGVQIGVNAGQVFSGTYGHPDRRAFTCIGDPVNLAARLMSKAPPGSIYVAEVVAKDAGDGFVWEPLEPFVVKGKSEAVRARTLVRRAQQEQQRHRRFALPMVGRRDELEVGRAGLADARAGRPAVVAITAEAGLGKSRLFAEILRIADDEGPRIVYGSADAVSRRTSYLPWRSLLRRLLDLSDDDPDEQQRQHVETVLEQIDPKLVGRAPLLDTVLAIDIPDNAVTARLDAELRKRSLEDLVLTVVCAHLEREPLVVALEDLQWADPPSLDLLTVLVRGTAELGVLFLLSSRPDAATFEPLRDLGYVRELQLTELDDETVATIVRTKISEQFGELARPSEQLIELVTDRAQGNPFYVEELVNFFREQSLDIEDPEALDHVTLPGSLHALVLSRIDGLAEPPRRALKVASIIGREFDAELLPLVFPDLGDVRHLLDELRANDLVIPFDLDARTWMFRHTITREVAYESTPHRVRAPLHEATGDAIIARAPDDLEFNLDLVTHHYWYSDNLDKKIDFVGRAADAAQAAYANATAIRYLQRLADTVPDPARGSEIALQLAQVLEVTGEWEAADRTAGRARDLAERIARDDLCAWADAARAEIARKQGRYDDAVELLERATAAFSAYGDDAGLGRTAHLLGTIAIQRGDLDDAVAHIERGITIRERLGDADGVARLLSNRGIVAEYAGDHETSAAFHRRALELRLQLGDRWAIANSYTNLGMAALHTSRPDGARRYFEDALHLNTEVGDAAMIALSRHNLANAALEQGDLAVAAHNFGAAAEAYQRRNDRFTLAFLLDDVAFLAARLDRPTTALELIGAADRLREELAAPRSDALEAQLTDKLRGPLTSTPTTDRAAARQRGRDRPLDESLRVVSQLCRG